MQKKLYAMYVGIRLAKLLLQFLLVEPLALEGVDLQRLCRKRIASLLNLLKRRYRGGAARKLLQPERILQFRISVLSDAEYSNLFELLKLAVCKAPDGEVVEIINENTADVRCQAVIGNDIDQQSAIHQGG